MTAPKAAKREIANPILRIAVNPVESVLKAIFSRKNKGPPKINKIELNYGQN